MKIRVILIIIVLLGSTFVLLNSNAQSQEANFTIVIETNLGNARREAYAYYLATVLPYLGINVELRFLPFSQFVGDLLFVSPKPYGIGIVGFVGGSVIAPDFYDLYHSQGFFGDLLYQLASDEWQSWLPNDPGSGGITQREVDNLIGNMTNSFDLLGERKQLTLQFQQMFMEQLLYDYPLLAPIGIFSIWHGLENFDPEEGTFGSAYLGAYWGNETPSDRQNNASTIAVRLASITGNFDPLQVADSETKQLLEGLFPQLLMFSKRDYSPHPFLAKQFNWTTWYNAPNPDPMVGGTIDIPYGRMDFWINDDWFWRYPNGTVFGPVTVDDVKFSFDLRTVPHTLINGKSAYQYIDHVETNATEGRVSVFVSLPRVDDIITFGDMDIVPYGLLGGDLHFANGTTINALNDTIYNPFETEEWNAFENNPVQSGPYYIDFSDVNQYKLGEYIYKWANPDFTFPNEWDSPNFDLRSPEAEDAYFFAWADDPNTAEHEKPTKMTINQFYYPIVWDFNAELSLFEAGEVDLTSPTAFGANELQAQINDPRFDVHIVSTTATADLLIFNLLDPNLKKYNVRRAIAHMVDKESLNYIIMNLQDPQDSPVKPFFKNNYYSDQWKIPFDYEAAKSFMRQEGYAVPDNPPTLPIFSSVDMMGVMDDSLQLDGLYNAPAQPEIVQSEVAETSMIQSNAWIFLAGIVILPVRMKKKSVFKEKRK